MLQPLSSPEQSHASVTDAISFIYNTHSHFESMDFTVLALNLLELLPTTSTLRGVCRSWQQVIDEHDEEVKQLIQHDKFSTRTLFNTSFCCTSITDRLLAIIDQDDVDAMRLIFQSTWDFDIRMAILLCLSTPSKRMINLFTSYGHSIDMNLLSEINNNESFISRYRAAIIKGAMYDMPHIVKLIQDDRVNEMPKVSLNDTLILDLILIFNARKMFKKYATPDALDNVLATRAMEAVMTKGCKTSDAYSDEIGALLSICQGDLAISLIPMMYSRYRHFMTEALLSKDSYDMLTVLASKGIYRVYDQKQLCIKDQRVLNLFAGKITIV
jgi:hypothetical protein